MRLIPLSWLLLSRSSSRTLTSAAFLALLLLISFPLSSAIPVSNTTSTSSFHRRDYYHPPQCSRYFGEPTVDDCLSIVSAIYLAVGLKESRDKPYERFHWKTSPLAIPGATTTLPRTWQTGHCRIQLLLDGDESVGMESWDSIISTMYAIVQECANGQDGGRRMGGWSWIQDSSLLVQVSWDQQSCHIRDMPPAQDRLEPEEIPRGGLDEAENTWLEAAGRLRGGDEKPDVEEDALSRASSCDSKTVDDDVLYAMRRAELAGADT